VLKPGIAFQRFAAAEGFRVSERAERFLAFAGEEEDFRPTARIRKKNLMMAARPSAELF
jgi:hypothetical protein